jgi:hypothetical protein
VADCAAIQSEFLVDWCAKTLAFNRNQLKNAPADFNANGLVFAAFARALLDGDHSICEDEYVARWVAVNAHVSDGSGACRDSLADLSASGTFTVSDPRTGHSVAVVLR